MDGLTVFLTNIGSNKMFVGLTMILMNLGSRFILGDLTPSQQALLQSEVVKKVVVFCMFFVPTRDVVISCMLTFAFFFVTQNLLDEKKSWNILNVGRGEAFASNQEEAYDVYYKQVQNRKQKI